MTGTPRWARTIYLALCVLQRYRHDRHPVIHLGVCGAVVKTRLKAANVTVSCCVCGEAGAATVSAASPRRYPGTRKTPSTRRLRRAWQRLAVGVQEAARDGRAAQGQPYPARTGRHRVLILVFQLLDCDGRRRLAGSSVWRLLTMASARCSRAGNHVKGRLVPEPCRCCSLAACRRFVPNPPCVRLGNVACPRTAAIDTGPPIALLLWASAMATSPVNP